MTRDLPPEERLLRLIKGKHKKDDGTSEEKSEPKKEPAEIQRTTTEEQKETSQREKPAKLKKMLSFATELSSGEKKLDPFKITLFLLTGFFIAGILYFSYELFTQRKQPPIIDIEALIPPEPEQPQEGLKEKEEQAAKGEIFEEVEFEGMPPEARELFGAPVTRETPPIEEAPSISELAKDLILVGVITGDNPQAIIQDRRTHQTFYVYQGESILEFKVKNIEKATVILEYNGESLKLSL